MCRCALRPALAGKMLECDDVVGVGEPMAQLIPAICVCRRNEHEKRECQRKIWKPAASSDRYSAPPAPRQGRSDKGDADAVDPEKGHRRKRPQENEWQTQNRPTDQGVELPPPVSTACSSSDNGQRQEKNDREPGLGQIRESWEKQQH